MTQNTVTGDMETLLRSLRKAAFLPDGAALSDGQLLELFLLGRDEMAIAALVQRHSRMVWGVCRRMLVQAEDAEDAFQATFLVLVRRAASIQPREMVGNWLYGVAHQTARKARALRCKRWAREGQRQGQPDPAAPAPDSCHDLLPLLEEEVGRLPDKYRAPIILCELQGKTRKEAADQLRWPEGTVAGRLARARALLAKRLTRRGVSLSMGSLALLWSEQTASACVPDSLLVSTIKGVIPSAAGQTATVSAKVLALTNEVLRTMLLKKLKTAFMVLLILGISAFTCVLLARETGEDKEGRKPEIKAAEAKAELKPERGKFDSKAALQPVPAGSDDLVRTFLGISSFRSRFMLPEGSKWYVLSIAKFDEGELVGYLDPGAPLGAFSSEGTPFQAEFGWGPKQGKFGYFVVTPWASAAFKPDEFFAELSVIHHLTNGKAPEKKLGPFYVLGYADDGKGKVPKDSKFGPLDVRRHIQGKTKVVALLLYPCETLKEAQAFLEDLPKLTGE